MKRLVQITSHKGKLFALGDDGSLWEIYVIEFRPPVLILIWEPPE